MKVSNKKKSITKVALYVGKDHMVGVDFDKTLTPDLLYFFVERKQLLPPFFKAVYDRQNHHKRTPSADEAEFTTLA